MKGDSATLNQVDGEAKAICHYYGIVERVNRYCNKAPFVTMKDHKPTFRSKPCCRLINPAYSEVGKISKGILDRIIPEIQSKLSLNQWKNSFEVIEWFKRAEKKNA